MLVKSPKSKFLLYMLLPKYSAQAYELVEVGGKIISSLGPCKHFTFIFRKTNKQTNIFFKLQV